MAFVTMLNRLRIGGTEQGRKPKQKSCAQILSTSLMARPEAFVLWCLRRVLSLPLPVLLPGVMLKPMGSFAAASPS